MTTKVMAAVKTGRTKRLWAELLRQLRTSEVVTHTTKAEDQRGALEWEQDVTRQIRSNAPKMVLASPKEGWMTLELSADYSLSARPGDIEAALRWALQLTGAVSMSRRPATARILGGPQATTADLDRSVKKLQAGGVEVRVIHGHRNDEWQPDRLLLKLGKSTGAQLRISGRNPDPRTRTPSPLQRAATELSSGMRLDIWRSGRRGEHFRCQPVTAQCWERMRQGSFWMEFDPEAVGVTLLALNGQAPPTEGRRLRTTSHPGVWRAEPGSGRISGRLWTTAWDHPPAQAQDQAP